MARRSSIPPRAEKYTRSTLARHSTDVQHGGNVAFNTLLAEVAGAPPGAAEDASGVGTHATSGPLAWLPSRLRTLVKGSRVPDVAPPDAVASAVHVSLPPDRLAKALRGRGA